MNKNEAFEVKTESTRTLFYWQRSELEIAFNGNFSTSSQLTFAIAYSRAECYVHAIRHRAQLGRLRYEHQ